MSAPSSPAAPPKPWEVNRSVITQPQTPAMPHGSGNLDETMSSPAHTRRQQMHVPNPPATPHGPTSSAMSYSSMARRAMTSNHSQHANSETVQDQDSQQQSHSPSKASSSAMDAASNASLHSAAPQVQPNSMGMGMGMVTQQRPLGTASMYSMYNSPGYAGGGTGFGSPYGAAGGYSSYGSGLYSPYGGAYGGYSGTAGPAGFGYGLQQPMAGQVGAGVAPAAHGLMAVVSMFGSLAHFADASLEALHAVLGTMHRLLSRMGFASTELQQATTALDLASRLRQWSSSGGQRSRWLLRVMRAAVGLACLWALKRLIFPRRRTVAAMHSGPNVAQTGRQGQQLGLEGVGSGAVSGSLLQGAWNDRST